MKKLLAILLLAPCLAIGQPAPVFEATTNQVAAGTVGAPFYVSPRGLVGAGIGSPTNGVTGAQAQALINTSSNSVYVNANTAINTSSNSVYSNSVTQINTTSNSLAGQITGGGITQPNLASALAIGTNAISLTNATSNTLPISAADTSWMPVTNAIAGTNQPITIGQALVVVGTNFNGATMVKGTNWPTGGGLTSITTSNSNWTDTNTINASSFLKDTNQTVTISTNGVAVVTLGTNGLVVASGTSNWLGGISFVASNAAPFSTVAPSGLNTITMNQRWTNNFNRRGDLLLNVTITDAATGVPILGFTNTITGESYTNSPNFGITGSPTYGIPYLDISPGDYGSISNYSTGTGTSITINSVWWKLH